MNGAANRAVARRAKAGRLRRNSALVPRSLLRGASFIGKLKEKKQNDQQLQQAIHAISLYYELDLSHSGKDNLFKDKTQNISIKKFKLKVI